MKRLGISCLILLLILAFAACGGGGSRPSSPGIGSSLDVEGHSGDGMPTPPLPITLLERSAAPVDPLELDAADAVSALPEDGILLFAQDEQRRMLRELPLTLEREQAREDVRLLVRASEDCTLPSDLIMYLRFDPGRFNPRSVEFADDVFPRDAHLQLAVLDQYAHIPFAVAALPGAERVRVRQRTILASIVLELAAQTVLRRASAAPTGDSNRAEVFVSLIGERARVVFYERNLGDFDLNGKVEIADISQLAMHYGKDDSFIQTPVIDAGTNSIVDIADITFLAMNYGSTLGGYDIELAFTPEEGPEGDFVRLENATEPSDPTLTRPFISLPQGWPQYEYLLPDMGYGTYKVRVTAVGETLSDVGSVSLPDQVVVQNLPPAPPSSFYAAGADRTSVTLNWSPSIATDLAGYNVYITEDDAADELADFTKLNAELLEPTATEYTASDLTPTTDYWFVIEAVDDKDKPSLENAVLATKVHASTVITPEVVVGVEAGDHYEMQEIAFTGEDSTSPDGAELVRFTWDWGDGTEPEDMPPPGAATHTFDTPNPTGFTVTLAVEDEYGAEGSAQAVVPVLALRRDVLVVYNINSADDLEIADYYASPETGRGIHPDYVYGMDLSTSQEIDRATYESTIRDPLRTHLEDSGQKDEIYYIVTCKHVPLRVSGDTASVDSELCLLFETYDTSGWLTNPFWAELSSNYADGHKGNMAESQPWQPFHFSYEGVTMNYLVTRLTGYYKEDALAIIDRSKTAFTGSEYIVIFDDDPAPVGDPNRIYDRMHIPNQWDNTEPSTTVFSRLGYSQWDDDTDVNVTALDVGAPLANCVLGYCSHGIHAQGGRNGRYILDELGFQYLPGALFTSYESYNGITFVWSDTHQGQGLIADFILEGGTGGVCNVQEPYGQTCADESVLFPEYLGGRNLAEACYKSLLVVSWMQCVVGDPLCTVSIE